MHRGKIHYYLGIDLDYRKQVTVKVSMIKYLDSPLEEFPEQLGKTAATPTANHIFTVRDKGKQ